MERFDFRARFGVVRVVLVKKMILVFRVLTKKAYNRKHRALVVIRRSDTLKRKTNASTVNRAFPVMNKIIIITL